MTTKTPGTTNPGVLDLDGMIEWSMFGGKPITVECKTTKFTGFFIPKVDRGVSGPFMLLMDHANDDILILEREIVAVRRPTKTETLDFECLCDEYDRDREGCDPKEPPTPHKLAHGPAKVSWEGPRRVPQAPKSPKN